MSAAALSLPQPWKIDRTTYHRLSEGGSFGGQHVQLINGVVIEMSPIGTLHSALVTSLTRPLVEQTDRSIQVRVQQPLAVDPLSEPEPDLALAPSVSRSTEHPSTALLVIEVADSSRALDLGPKALLYARARVPEYWVIDLKREETVVHRTPRSGRYTSVRKVGKRQRLACTSVPGVSLELAPLLA